MKSRIFVSWVGLRGAVPIIFATYPVVAGVEGSNLIFNIVFFYYHRVIGGTGNNDFFRSPNLESFQTTGKNWK